MRVMRVCLLLLSFCLLAGCTADRQKNLIPATTDNTTAPPELKMPDALKEVATNPNLQWMAGMLAVLEDSEMILGISQDSYKVFSDPGDVIRATITTQSGIDLSQEFDLMVFADGVSTEFTVDGESYWSYPMYLSQQKKSIEIEFNREFALNLGRLDFVLSFTENPKADYHLATYTVWIDLDGDVKHPTNLCSTIEQRAGIKGSFSGDTYNAWFWNEGVIPAEIDNVGPRTISIQDGETVLLEAIASAPGLYRTVLVVDGTPIEFEMDGSQYSYLDWESTGTNMLQLPVILTDVPSTGSIYTITTPLDKDDPAKFIVASGKVELVADVEE